ncbi:unnamed protein product [Ilex paraguariensis]|uniref:Uncharacterized protein n=1 Tax=Ilex paraguariensis TaxID=185542 RepID=A0ABC8UL04_9AQUA
MPTYDLPPPQSSTISLPRSFSSPVVPSPPMNTKAANPTLPELPENSVLVSIPINTPSDHPRDIAPPVVQDSCTAGEETRNTEMKISIPAYRRSASERLPINTVNTNRTQKLNPVVQLLRDQELGKTVLGFVVPLTAVFLSAYAKDSHSSVRLLTVLPLCIGLTALWNGLLLRTTFHRFSIALEQIGAGCILFAFFGVMGSFLPPQVSWASWIYSS